MSGRREPRPGTKPRGSQALIREALHHGWLVGANDALVNYGTYAVRLTRNEGGRETTGNVHVDMYWNQTGKAIVSFVGKAVRTGSVFAAKNGNEWEAMSAPEGGWTLAHIRALLPTYRDDL